MKLGKAGPVVTVDDIAELRFCEVRHRQTALHLSGAKHSTAIAREPMLPDQCTGRDLLQR